MAQASGKDLHDYLRLNTTKAFLEELSLETGIPGSKIIQVRKRALSSAAREAIAYCSFKIAIPHGYSKRHAS